MSEDQSWADKAFELEKQFQLRHMEQIDSVRTQVREQYETIGAFNSAYAKIAQAALSALDNKNVVIPSIHGPNYDLESPDDETVVELTAMVTEYVTMGRDFEIILQAIKENPMLMGEWENFMMLLRMTE